MESASQIGEWISYAKKSLGLKITQLTWPSKFDVDLVDFEFSINFNGRLVKGRGTHKDIENAFARAISELVERVTIVESGILSSSGLAAHPSEICAVKFARQELFERLSCENNYLTQGPVFLANHYVLKGMTVRQYLIEPTTAIVLIEGKLSSAKPFHLCIGHAKRENQLEAIHHATIEALRTAAWLSFNEVKPPIAQLQLGRFWTTGAKYVLGFNVDYANLVTQSFRYRETSHLNSEAALIPTKIARLTIPSELKTEWLNVLKADPLQILEPVASP